MPILQRRVDDAGRGIEILGRGRHCDPGRASGRDRSRRGRHAGEEQVQDRQDSQRGKAAGEQAADRDAVLRHSGCRFDVPDLRRRSQGACLGDADAAVGNRAKYIEQVAALSDTPAERLAFFQEYFEDPDQLLQGDAFNEFAKAPYTDVVQLKDKMHREKLIEWIKDDKVPASRRRLYLTMLGMCGTQDDVPMIEAMIKTDDRQVRQRLDAMIGCYLNLRGADGLPLIEDQFLKNDKSEYVDTYSAIVALRVLGQETNVIPKDRLVGSLRHMLDRPQLADLVIPDLARWQDWGSMDKLVDLFKNANEESSWVRVPVVQFLRACPEPKAKEYIDELAKIDPDAVKRTTNYLALPGAGGPAVATTAAPAAAKTDEPAAAADAAKSAEATATPTSETPKTETVAPRLRQPASPPRSRRTPRPSLPPQKQRQRRSGPSSTSPSIRPGIMKKSPIRRTTCPSRAGRNRPARPRCPAVRTWA